MIEKTILSNLIFNDDYVRKVIPYIKPEYFFNRADQIIFGLVSGYIHQYNTLPPKTSLEIELNNLTNIDENGFKEANALLESLNPESLDMKWLVDHTENFCQDKAIYNSVASAIAILENKDNKAEKGMIPKLLQDALAVSFDTSIGHDYLEDWMARYKFYHTPEFKIPFDIELLNKITGGGVTRKTLTVLIGGIGFGKSLCMCHMASANLLIGKNVLYITLEMSEERIAERIDANLLDIPLTDLALLPEAMYAKKIAKVQEKTIGKLIIKEYPSTSAGADNFRHLIHELKIKKNFVPDIIYLDYLNLCKSSRVKFSGNLGLYTYIMSITQEIRGLAQEQDVPIITATQLNREGFKSSDPGMEHTSESFGTPAQADLQLAIVTNDEMAKDNQVMFKQLKNRYNDPNINNRFLVGCDRRKMRLFDVEESAQTLIGPEIVPVQSQSFEHFDPFSPKGL